MDLIYQFNEFILDFYIKYAPGSLQGSQFQIFFMRVINAYLFFFIVGVIYIPMKKIKNQIKREKMLVICLAIFVNALFISGLANSTNSESIKFLALIPLNLFFYVLYKLGDWFKKFNIETRLSGDLNLTKVDTSSSNILNCPSCNNRTISYWHAIKEAQTCGECKKIFKAEHSRKMEMALLLLMVATFFLGFYLSVRCDFNKFINLLVMLSGFIILVFYQLKPKRLVEVKVQPTV